MIIKTIGWIKTHKGIAITSSFIIFLGIALGSAFIIQMKQLEDRGWEILSVGQFLAMQGQAQEAHRYFNELESRYSRTKLGDFSLLLHGTLFAREANWPEALNRYQSILTGKKTKPLMPLASIGLARAYEVTGKTDLAKTELQNFLNQYPDHFAMPQAYEGLARLFSMSGEKDKAKQYLERLRVLYPETIWAKRAEATLRLLQ
ncbi:MAG: tetratricopeptide repeat protein [Elusimicrobia bacterium]|nr:tetratricopeptide repeat protein [Elusimicrobiota bacterium]